MYTPPPFIFLPMLRVSKQKEFGRLEPRLTMGLTINTLLTGSGRAIMIYHDSQRRSKPHFLQISHWVNLSTPVLSHLWNSGSRCLHRVIVWTQ